MEILIRVAREEDAGELLDIFMRVDSEQERRMRGVHRHQYILISSITEWELERCFMQNLKICW